MWKLLHRKSLHNDSHLIKYHFYKNTKRKHMQKHNTDICFTVTNICYAVLTTYDILKTLCFQSISGYSSILSGFQKGPSDRLSRRSWKWCVVMTCFIFSRPIYPPPPFHLVPLLSSKVICVVTYISWVWKRKIPQIPKNEKITTL